MDFCSARVCWRIETSIPLVWDILGWNIQLYISHLIVYPAEPEKDKVLTGGWHASGWWATGAGDGMPATAPLVKN